MIMAYVLFKVYYSALPAIKNLPASAGNMGSIPGEGTKMIYKKGRNGPDNIDGVVTHLEIGILQCEVKWALGSITRNKVSGDDGIPVELFQILEDDAGRD